MPKQTNGCALIVDGSHAMRLMLELGLATEGYAVLTASDASEARDHLATNLTIDVIFCDLDTPGVRGLDLIRGLRSFVATAAIPVVVLASDAEGQTAAAMALPGCWWMRRPFTLGQIREFARVAVSLRYGRPAN